MKKEGQAFRLSQSIPLMIDGVVYLSWPWSHVAALEPETGKVLWEYTAKGDYRGNELEKLMRNAIVRVAVLSMIVFPLLAGAR